MLEKLSYNRLNWIYLVTFSVLFIVSLLRLLVFTSEAIAIGLLFTFIIILLGAIVVLTNVAYRARVKQSDERLYDELSRVNDWKAASLTLTIVICALGIFVVVGSILEVLSISLTLGYMQFMCLTAAIFTVRHGFYLYYERQGLKNAGTDDED